MGTRHIQRGRIRGRIFGVHPASRLTEPPLADKTVSSASDNVVGRNHQGDCGVSSQCVPRTQIATPTPSCRNCDESLSSRPYHANLIKLAAARQTTIIHIMARQQAGQSLSLRKLLPAPAFNKDTQRDSQSSPGLVLRRKSNAPAACECCRKKKVKVRDLSD